MAKKQAETIYQIRISLDHIRPPIWRRVLVPGKYTLGDLHEVIQVAMGWQFSHLHEFVINDQSFSPPEETEFDEFEDSEDENAYRLIDVVEECSRFSYAYDFGDSWDHTLQVEKVFPAEEGMVVPVCIKGKRACPPEDVGGFLGYQHFLEVMANPDDPEYSGYLEWIGGPFDPEAFDLDDINQRLAGLESNDRSNMAVFYTNSDAPQNIEKLIPPEVLRAKFLALPPLEEMKPLTMLALMTAMLSYIRDNKVTGTKSLGNFPKKAVLGIIEQSSVGEEILARIGSQLNYLRNEEDFLLIFYVHILAAVAGLIVGGPGKRWQLTQPGEGFLKVDPRVQLGLMFMTWWYKMNWMAAVPTGIPGFELTDEFRSLTYQSLISLPVDKEVPSQKFLKPFIKGLGLPTALGDEYIEEFFTSFLASVILVPLHGLGIIRMDMEILHTESIVSPKLKAVKLTPLGKEILSILPAQ